MKARNILFLILASLLLCTAVSAAEYTDVSDAHWAYKQINYLDAEITGYPDGTYKPENTVTRAEFLTLFARIAFPEEWKQAESDDWWKAAYSVCIAHDLLDGIIDISVARTPLRLDEVSYMELCSEPMIAVSAPENTASSLKLADLLHRPLILYRRYEELIMNTFHAQNMNPDIFCVCDDPRGAMLWAKENLATAIFPQSMASLCDGLCIQELDEPDLVTKILLIWAKGKKPVPLVQEFLDVCGEH